MIVDAKTWTHLLDQAQLARRCAYAPYSQFTVGAALLDEESGAVFTGANIENVSFGLTMCAERVAIGSALVAGAKRFQALALVADSLQPIVPCGACRQVLAEFSPALVIRSVAYPSGAVEDFRLAELLPKPRQGILDGQSST
jgi:cytidine deaminase